MSGAELGRSDPARDRMLASLATPEGRAKAITYLVGEGFTTEQARMLADPDIQRCLDPRSLDDVCCCYGGCADPKPPAADRRNAMLRTSTAKKPPSQETMGRLEAAERKLSELTARTSRRVMESEISAALKDGRISVAERGRWFERADELGVDVARDLIRERRPDRQLAAANAVGEITAEQDAALVQVFPHYEPRNS
jgi:hypothetical protein